MQHLLLEPAEGRLDALRRAVVRRRRPIDAADVREELLRDLAPLAALIVGDDLVGFAAGRLDGHAEGGELRVEVLAGADRIAEQRFAVSVNDLIDRNRADDGLAVFDRLVEQVELRAVAVPQRIAHGRHFGLVAAGVELLGRQLAVDGVVPQRLDLRPFEVLNQRRLRGERLPSAALGDAVELLEELLGRVDRDAAAAQGHDLPACRFGNLQRIRVAELTRHEADIALLAILPQLVAQAGFALRERMPVSLAQLLGCGKDIRPDYGRMIAVSPAHRLLRFEHIPQGVQHPCVQRVFGLLLLRQMVAIRKQVPTVELLSIRINCKRHFVLFHHLFGITIFFLEAGAESLRKRAIFDQGIRAETLARTQNIYPASADELVVVAFANHRFTIVRPCQLVHRYRYYVSEIFHRFVVLDPAPASLRTTPPRSRETDLLPNFAYLISGLRYLIPDTLERTDCTLHFLAAFRILKGLGEIVVSGPLFIAKNIQTFVDILQFFSNRLKLFTSVVIHRLLI